ncbi:MAG: FtsX-like permease family protein [Bacteroidota bacterium]
MIRNYLLIAIRNLMRQKFFALLNMFGLALGLACAALVFLYVSDELRYDSMQPHYKNTYRVGASFSNKDGRVFDNTVSPGYWMKYLKENRSEIQNAVRIDYIGYPTSLNNKAADKIILTEEIKWAEPHFDEVVLFDLLKGNKQKMFDNNNTIVISETGAKKLFGVTDPIGKVVTVKHNWATRDKEIDVMVTGVYRDYPSNSHFKPLYILNVNALRSVHDDFTTYMEGTRFGNNNMEFFENYIVVKPGADLKPILADLNKLAKQMSEADSGFVAGGWKMNAFIAPLSSLHFDQKNLWENGVQGNKKYLLIFSGVALSILLIACINYMNLATARSARRAKEVGLRKSLGSNRVQIAKQFFYESALMTVGSLIIATFLVVIFLHSFNQLANKSFSIGSLFDPVMIGIVMLIVVVMAIVSGSYPAIYLSKFKPADVLKGQLIKGKGAELFRKTLVTIQYTVALVLMISTFVVIRQMKHMQQTKLNEQGNQLLSIRYGGTAPQDKFAVFKQEVLKDKDIQHVTMANHLPRLNYFGWIGATVKVPGIEEKELQWNELQVEFDFAKTYSLEFVAGRDFDASRLEDSNMVLINETAVKALKKTPENMVGANIVLVNDSNRAARIIGVVKDFPFRSMHQPIEPLMLNPHVHFIDRIAYIKLPAGRYQEKIASIEKEWKKIFPGVGFDYWFVSDEFNRMYVAERRMTSLAKTFAILAILITALGVFGLAAYTAEQKTKEVGIRKVLGASVQHVVQMFTWLFIKMLLISGLIAIPVAYIMAYKWLEGFAYRSSINPMIFIISLSGLLVVTLLTVSYTTMKAANSNPVDSLRRE